MPVITISRQYGSYGDDLIINTGNLPVAAAVDLIVMALHALPAEV